MGCGKDQMSRGVDQGGEGMGFGTPEQENQMVPLARQFGDGLGREGLPSQIPVGHGFGLLNGQQGIHQKHALVSPGREVRALGFRVFLCIVGHFTENVS